MLNTKNTEFIMGKEYAIVPYRKEHYGWCTHCCFYEKINNTSCVIRSIVNCYNREIYFKEIPDKTVPTINKRRRIRL